MNINLLLGAVQLHGLMSTPVNLCSYFFFFCGLESHSFNLMPLKEWEAEANSKHKRASSGYSQFVVLSFLFL